MQMALQINMIYFFNSIYKYKYQKANTTTAGNYSSLNSWVDTFTFTLIVVIKPDILIGCNIVLYS